VIGWAIRQVVIWGGLAWLLFVIVGPRVGEFLPKPGAPIEARPVAAQDATGGRVVNSLVYRADTRGHVMVDGNVNGTRVQFLVDTGATVVALTMADAAAAGLSRNDLVFRDPVQTASGVAHVAPVTLRELRVGQFSARDVPAAVVENLSVSLLGQSFLRRLDSYQMRDGVLTLNWN